ncbi:MAG: hypothetical protein ACUVQ8_00500 [Nitrososphaeria archaeon]
MTKDLIQNIILLLYLAPFLTGIIGWAYYFAILGPSETNFYTLFIVVSKDPFLFLIGFTGVVVATVLDAKGSGESIGGVMSRVEKIALALLIVEAITVFLVAEMNITKIFFMFVDGKYAVILPLSLLIYSYLIPLGRIHLQKPSVTSLLNTLSILIMIGAPAFIFYMYAFHATTNMYEEGVVVFLIGFTLFIFSNYQSFLKKIGWKA